MIWCFSPKYGGLGDVSSSGFWNSFPFQLLFSELFSFISPTSTVGCILSILTRSKQRREGDSRLPRAWQTKLFKVVYFTYSILRSSEVVIFPTVSCCLCFGLLGGILFYRGKANRSLDTLRAFWRFSKCCTEGDKQRNIFSFFISVICIDTLLKSFLKGFNYYYLIFLL